MSTPPSVPPPKVPPAPPDPGVHAGKPTWLCQFSVLVDFPDTMSINDMEGAVAFALAQYLGPTGLPANVSVQLIATAGNQTVMTSKGFITTNTVDINQRPPKGPGAPV